MSNQESDILNDFHNYCINPKKREIFLHNYYSSDDDNPGVEWKMASVFIKNLRKTTKTIKKCSRNRKKSEG